MQRASQPHPQRARPTPAHSPPSQGGTMKLSRIPLTLMILSIAVVPVRLAAQDSTTKSPARKTAAPGTSAATSAPTQAQPPSQQTAAATEQAKCKDGSMYSGKSRQGACSSHGGVAQWLTPGQERGPEGRHSTVQRRHLLYEDRATGGLLGPQRRGGVAEERLAVGRLARRSM